MVANSFPKALYETKIRTEATVSTLGYFTFRVVQREVYYVYVENTRGSANATRDYCAAAGGFAGLKKSSLRGMFLPVLTHSKSNK